MSVDSDIGPFAIVPEWVLRAVSPQAIVLFAELALHADRKTAKAWPSRARLAERLGVTTKTIDRSLKELVDIFAIEKHPRLDDTGWHSSLYLVKYASPGRAMSDPTPTPTDVPQNQNHSEPEPRTIYTPEFEAFWSAYPHKVGKGAASAAFKAATKRATATRILDATQEFASSVLGQELRYVAHPATWLNQNRWEDELATAAPEREVEYHTAPEQDEEAYAGFLAAVQDGPWSRRA